MKYEELIVLAQELRAGDNRRLTFIFQENSKYCIRKLRFKFLCSQEDAEDIYTDAVINFREKVITGKIEVLTDIKAYLYATCRNMFLARIEKGKRLKNAIAEIYQSDESHHLELENTHYFEEILKITEQAMCSIPERCRKLLESFYFDQLTLNELANKFNFANGNVAKVSKSRCLQCLVNTIKSFQQEKATKEDVIK